MSSLRKLLSNVPDAEVRMRVLNRYINEAEPGAISAEIQACAVSTDQLPSRLLMTSLAHLLMECRPRPSLEAGPFVSEPRKDWPTAVTVARIIGAAMQGDHSYTAPLLRELWQLPDRSDERMLAPHISIEHLALGVRRERARSPRRALFEPLLVENHPSVVTLLARNTRLRDLDAVRMMALRPQHPYALWAMLLRPRWLSSPTVLEAIALNPACQPWMLLTIAPLVPAAVLARVLRTQKLSPEVVGATRELHRGAIAHVADEVLARRRRYLPPVIIEVDEPLEGPGVDLNAALGDIIAPDETPKPLSPPAVAEPQESVAPAPPDSERG
ncbi:MAG: hypothetical protein KC502_04180 [Myxococcales bacterium]|nr:hypothetical protein [Myxococcales bacterium]